MHRDGKDRLQLWPTSLSAWVASSPPHAPHPVCRDANGRLRLGDIIVGIDGKPVKLQRDLFEALDEKRPGDRVEVEVLREGDKGSAQKITVELGGRELGGPSD